MQQLRLFLISLFFAQKISAQVVINEVCAANLNGGMGAGTAQEDWFELYNTGSVAVDLSGWFLSDNPAKPQKWAIPAGQSIAAGAYRVVVCSGADGVAGNILYPNFKITQTEGESAVLTRPNGTQADLFTFVIPNQTGHSYGRAPNGSNTWKVFTAPTPAAANGNTSFAAYTASVQASVEAGFFASSVSVGLSGPAGATIQYTTDGSEPTAAATTYAGPINISATTVLKARAYSSSSTELPGFVLCNTYFINANHTVPVVSVSGNNVDELFNGTQSFPSGAFEYFEGNMLRTEGYGEFNEHGNDSWAYPQRGVDWITRDQIGYANDLEHKFFEERTRTKFQRLILKAAASDNYPFESGAHIRDPFIHTLALRGGLKVDARTSKSCVVYVNGQYWGVYDLREKVDDHDYTEYYYDQGEKDIDYIKTWGSTWAEYGSISDWNTLKNYILGNSMAVQGNYDYAISQLNPLSLIDYVLINQHTVNKDWLNWNTSWWRGRNPNGDGRRWRYALWDMDATFDHYINFTGIPNPSASADPCDVEQIPNSGDPQNHIDIFMALYANPTFKALYINRYADLMNGALSCTRMKAVLDSMVNVMQPEMGRHCIRWGGNVATWQNRVQAIRTFIDSRCVSIDQSIVDCYDVLGPYNLTVQVSPAGPPNRVAVNTLTPTTYPFTGEYFGGIAIPLEAKPAQGWQFDHWEVNGNSFSPDQYAAAIQLAFQTTGTVTAFFIELVPCTAPTALAISTMPNDSDTLTWNGPTSASGYLVQYRKSGASDWLEVLLTDNVWSLGALPGCSDYEVQIQSVCPHEEGEISGQFDFTTQDLLQGFAGLADATACNTATFTLDATWAGASILWDNGSTASTRTVAQSGVYSVQLQNGACSRGDTVIVLLVNATANVNPVRCTGETYVVGSEVFDSQRLTGQVVLAQMAAGGCDSIVNVSLTIVPSAQTNISAQSCNPAFVGIDTLVLSTFNGCDSLVITNTTYDAAAVSTTFLTALDCDPAMVGLDTLVLTNIAGCDSLVVTTTALAPISQINLTAQTCNPAQVGMDTLVLTNVYGCDSLAITNTVFDAAAIPITQLAALNCDPSMVGVDTLVLTNVAGCDSLVVTTTALAPISQINLTAQTCNPAQVGMDTLVLTNVYGCDSLVVTNTVFDVTLIPVTQLAALNCDPAMVGVDTLVLTNAVGCDSLVVTTTALAPVSQINLTAQTCNPAQVGMDTLVLTNVYGCDSLVVTNTVFDVTLIPVTQLAALNCDPAMVGVDTLVLTNAVGCDSLVVTTTALAPISQINLIAQTCNPAQVGLDTLVLTNVYGCDSLVITNTVYDPTTIIITSLTAQSCDPTQVGITTGQYVSVGGCDSLVLTTTVLVPTSQTQLSATTCDLALAGVDTVQWTNVYGCDSLVVTTTAYVGLDWAISVSEPLCFGEDDGFIQIDDIETEQLPVRVELEGQPEQTYTGAAVGWQSLAAGTYLLTATNAAGCTLEQSAEVQQGIPLQLDLGAEPLQVHLGDSVLLLPNADFQVITAQWSPVTALQCPTCASTLAAPQQSTQYALTATDANGCTATAKVLVQVDQRVRVFVPNVAVFDSPDGQFEFTVFGGPEVESVRDLRLYDRWGNLVYEQRNLAPNAPSGWDGRYKGRRLPPGVLVWACTVHTIDGREIPMSGDVTLLD